MPNRKKDPKIKKLSKGQKIHARRVKQAARKGTSTGG